MADGKEIRDRAAAWLSEEIERETCLEGEHLQHYVEGIVDGVLATVGGSMRWDSEPYWRGLGRKVVADVRRIALA